MVVGRPFPFSNLPSFANLVSGMMWLASTYQRIIIKIAELVKRKWAGNQTFFLLKMLKIEAFSVKWVNLLPFPANFKFRKRKVLTVNLSGWVSIILTVMSPSSTKIRDSWLILLMWISRSPFLTKTIMQRKQEYRCCFSWLCHPFFGNVVHNGLNDYYV